MNNRLDDLMSAQARAIEPSNLQAPSRDEFPEYIALVKQWAFQHPLPCLATAFLMGAAVAWLVKRR